MRFKDRIDAGGQLAKKLKDEIADRENVLLYALPRGGVVIGVEIAREFDLPLDVIVTRKIGAPYNEEYAIGALAETGDTLWNEGERSAHDPEAIQAIVDKEKKEAKRRIKTYRKGRPLPSFKEKTVLIVDDGLATGLTMRAAIATARHKNAKEIIVAIPHGAKDSIRKLRKEGVHVIALSEPLLYGAVGQFYETFSQTEDEEVLKLLDQYGAS